MKTAFLTDLHANREAVESVIDHARQQGAQRWVLLGDFVGYGADPAWVVDKMRELVRQGAVAVMGNHDQAVVRGAAPGMRADARFVIEWTRAQLNAEQLVPLYDGGQLYVVQLAPRWSRLELEPVHILDAVVVVVVALREGILVGDLGHRWRTAAAGGELEESLAAGGRGDRI